jgi:anti-sigma B factor antagonist
VEGYLSVAVRQSERSTVLSVEGELDLASSGQLEDAIRRLGGDAELLVIDLEKLRFIDMAGLRVLLAAHQEAARAGRRVVLANVRDPIRRTLTLAQVDGLLPTLDGRP